MIVQKTAQDLPGIISFAPETVPSSTTNGLFFFFERFAMGRENDRQSCNELASEFPAFVLLNDAHWQDHPFQWGGHASKQPPASCLPLKFFFPP
jgi:hypothetical protein